MLISHSRKFIYLKTRKTGGTSVEIYFEPYCVDPDGPDKPRHEREAAVSPWGVVGYRGLENKDTWYGHMPAEQIRARIGENVWNEYFKFCVIRNPFDRVVSLFWFLLTPPVRSILNQAGFSSVRRTFQVWAGNQRLQDNRKLDNRSIYSIGDAPSVDYFVRFEHLQADMEEVCRRLAVAWNPEQLGRFKSEYRLRTEHFSEYYDPDTVDHVGRQHSWEIEYFGYSPPAG